MEKKDHTFMGKDNCPTCNYQLDCATKATGEHEIPMPHDLSVCLNCGEWLEYDDDMALILMPPETKKELSRDNIRELTLASEYIKKRGFIKK